MQSISPARLTANQANAKLSTGPRTAAGKAISSRNARTHGLCSRDLIVQPHEQPEFAELLQAHRAELQPQGALEQTQFDLIVHATWNLRRIRRMEAGLCRGLDPLAALDDEPAPAQTRPLRPPPDPPRMLPRPLRRTLKKLQTERTQSPAAAPPPTQPAPEAHAPRMTTTALVRAVSQIPGLKFDRERVVRACVHAPGYQAKLEQWLHKRIGALPQPVL